MLREEAAAVLAYVERHERVSAERVAQTLLRTRVPRRYRALAMAADRDSVITALRAIAQDREHPSVVRSDAPADEGRRAFVFPGQGGQRPGMGRLFYEDAPAYRAALDQCDTVFRALFDESPLAYLLDDTAEADDSATVVQPALFTHMIGLAALWRSVGVEPDAVIGHSQGEIAAAYVAGKMTLADAAVVVGTRARAVDRIASDRYAMAVLDADRAECEALLARRPGWAQVSVLNSPQMVGISGDREVVTEIVDTMVAEGRFGRVIRVRYPAHTSVVNEFRADIADAVRARLTNTRFVESGIDCIGATFGALVPIDQPVDEYWFLNLRNPVRFDLAVAEAVTRDVTTFVELAEHPTLQLPIGETLTALAGDRATTVLGTSRRTATDLSVFTRNLATLAVRTLHYPWERLRVESELAPRPPLLDFPNVLMNQTTMWLAHQRTAATSATDRQATAAPVSAAHAPAVHARAVPDSLVLDSPVPDSAVRAATPQVLVETWDRLVRRTLTPPRVLGLIDHTGACADLAAALCAEAENHGASARVIDAEEDISELDTLVVLLPELPELDGAAVATEVGEFFGIRRWWTEPGAGIVDYWLVTVGGEAVVAEDRPPHPVPAAASAGLRSVGTEYPGVALRHLDITAAQENSPAKILTALHTAVEPELALRAGALYAKRLVEAEQVGTPRQDYQHVVIIGGTGSVGLEFTEHFARRGVPRITLVSRSGGSAVAVERLREVRAVTASGIHVHACDVGDVESARRLADELRATPADLVIHAAADHAGIVNLELAETTSAHTDQVLRGKVVGLANILDVLARTDDCRIILCSSLAATLGGRGTLVYAAANRVLDAYAHHLRAEGYDCVSVQWGQWAVHEGDGAADTSVLAEVGYLPMRSADAIALGLSALPGNAVIAAFDWERGRSVLGAYGYGPVLSKLESPVGDGATPATRTSVSDATAAHLPSRIAAVLADVIGVGELDTIDNTRSLVSLGLDSLQALELRRRITSEFGYELPVAELIGGASLNDVVGLVGKHGVVRPDSTETGTPGAVTTPIIAASRTHRAQPERGTKSVPTAPTARGVQAPLGSPAGSASVDPAGATPDVRTDAGTSRPAANSIATKTRSTGTAAPTAQGVANERHVPLGPPAGSASVDPAGVSSVRRATAPTSASHPVMDDATSRPVATVTDSVVAGAGSTEMSAPGQYCSETSSSVDETVRASTDHGVAQQVTARSVIAAAPESSVADPIGRARLGAAQIVPDDLDADRIRSARRDVDLFGLRAMLAAIAPALDSATASTAEEIGDRLEFVPRHRWLLRQWLLALTENGVLEQDGAQRYRRVREVASPSRSGLDEVCLDLGYPAELAPFFVAADDNLTSMGQDRIRVQELLFADGGTDIAAASYRENLISRYLNRAAREVIAELAARLRVRRSPVRILELGAGVGGTTADVVAGLGGLPVEYHFSDVSNFFLDAARTQFADYPWMRFDIVDMNTDLARQPRYDLVIAANVLHNAHDVGHTLRQLHDLLTPNGALVFIETCHAHAQLLTSVHFLMSPRAGQPHAGLTDVRAGTDRIFLTENEWVGELSAAGLRPLATLPDPDHPLALLDQRLFTAVRDPDA
ncbi:nocobactin polyketide synthase NbtC [Nocardia callitridis]|uniref:nocobactin polyketide synthase NbtC n=1 Tax=Nocardia callitridis TaxID=648753 RepID=UPI0031E6B8E5